MHTHCGDTLSAVLATWKKMKMKKYDATQTGVRDFYPSFLPLLYEYIQFLFT